MNFLTIWRCFYFLIIIFSALSAKAEYIRCVGNTKIWIQTLKKNEPIDLENNEFVSTTTKIEQFLVGEESKYPAARFSYLSGFSYKNINQKFKISNEVANEIKLEAKDKFIHCKVSSAMGFE